MAVESEGYIHNQTINTKTTIKRSRELFLNVRPQVENSHVFGLWVAVYVPVERRKILDHYGMPQSP